MLHRKPFYAALIVAALLFSALDAFAFTGHKYHTSLTRMDYNAEDRLIEITIQLFTHDLREVLEKKAKNFTDLEKTPGIDLVIDKYLNENFRLENEKDSAGKLIWVGKQIKADLTYIYVEIPFEGDFESLKLKNSIFFETFPKQTNLVIFRFNGDKADLYYKVGDDFKQVKTPAEN